MHAIIIIKRKNCLYYPKFGYPVFTVMDEPEIFTNDINKPGLYYIETDSYFPLRGNGWYYHCLISYCLDIGIISRNNIKYVVYASTTLKNDYYNGFIEYCNKNILSYEEIQENYNKKADEYKYT